VVAVYPEKKLLPHVRKLWIAMERISGSRMQVALPDWLEFNGVAIYASIHFLEENKSVTVFSNNQ
jgi:hypothetical protein